MKLSLFFSFLMVCGTIASQDTIKIKRDVNYDKNCFLVVCINKECFTDSISKKLFFGDNNIELRMNSDCTVNKKFDIFVSSFEAFNGEGQYSNAQSSFFTDPQKRIIQKIKPKDILLLKNIIVHAPDGFKKMDDLKIVVN